MREQIGTYTLEEETTFRRSYEVAAWWTEIIVPAGTYPVFAEVQPDGKVKDFPGPTARLEGVQGTNHTPSLFGGVAYGNSNADKGRGEPATYGVSPYAHALAKALVDGEGGRWTLDDGFEARPRPFTYKGERRVTYEIVRSV